MSRGSLSMLLFRKAFQPFPGPEQLTMILGSTCCTWRKEIKPYQSYEIWTRVLSWDEKWIYMVAHFVEPDSFLPTEWVLKPHSKPAKSKTRTNKAPSKAVFASSVSRYVFKSGRKTVPPEVVLQRCRLLLQRRLISWLLMARPWKKSKDKDSNGCQWLSYVVGGTPFTTCSRESRRLLSDDTQPPRCCVQCWSRWFADVARLGTEILGPFCGSKFHNRGSSTDWKPRLKGKPGLVVY